MHQSEECIGHPGLRGEVVHFIIQEKAGGGSDVRTIAIVERVGAGDGVASSVHDGKMSRVRAFAETYECLRGGRSACSDAASMGIAGLDDFAR